MTGAAQVEQQVERQVELEADPDTVWHALTDDELLADWFGPGSSIDARPGGVARFVDDDGAVRDAVVEAAEPGERLVVRWWPEHAPGRAGRVEFELVPCVSGTRLVVRETAPSAGATTSRWDLRMTMLAFAVTSGVRASAWA